MRRRRGNSVWEVLAGRMLRGETVFAAPVCTLARHKRTSWHGLRSSARSRTLRSGDSFMFQEALLPACLRNTRAWNGILPCLRWKLDGDWFVIDEPRLRWRAKKGRTARLRQLLDAAWILAPVHDRGLLHLDLKPVHLVTTCDGRSFVLDWESARFAGSRHRFAIGFCGTPGYMAPEQASGDCNRFESSTDVFALGVILFEILHERRARSSEEPLTEALRRVRAERIACSPEVVRRWPALARLPTLAPTGARQSARGTPAGSQRPCGKRSHWTQRQELFRRANLLACVGQPVGYPLRCGPGAGLSLGTATRSVAGTRRDRLGFSVYL